MAVAVAQSGRVELDELEIGERRAGGPREEQSLAGRAARVRRPRPERRIPARREDDGRAARRARAATSTRRRPPLETRIRGCSRARARVRRHRRCGVPCPRRRHGRRARGSGRLRARALVEARRRGRGATRSARAPRWSGARPRSAGRCHDRPRACLRRGEPDRRPLRPRRRRRPARHSCSSGVGRLREDCDRRAFVGGGESGGESGDPGSDDGDVDLVAFLPHER